MFKTICLFALIAFVITQDVSDVSDAANAISSAASSAASNVTVGTLVSDAVGTAETIASSANLSSDDVPVLNKVTVGYGNKSVVITPVASNVTVNDWLESDELLSIERASINAADGEWTLTWSVEDGDNWALLNNNGDLVVVDYVNGEQNIVADLGSNAAVDTEIANGAEQIVDAAYNSGEDVVSTSDIVSQLDNLVDQVWNDNTLQGFLSQNSDNTVASAVSNAASSASGDVSSAVSSAVNGAV